MALSSKERKARKRLLKKKAAKAKKNQPPLEIALETCHDCGQPFDPADDWGLGKDDFWSYPFPDDAYQQFTDCDEAVYLPNGVMLKFYPHKVIIRAPEALRGRAELEELVSEFTLPHYTDIEQYNSIHRREGIDAAMEYFGHDDLRADWGFWPEPSVNGQGSSPQPPSELLNYAFALSSRGPEQWTYHLPDGVFVCFSGTKTVVRGPGEIIDLPGFRMMVGGSVLDRLGLRKRLLETYNSEDSQEATKLLANISYQDTDKLARRS